VFQEVFVRAEAGKSDDGMWRSVSEYWKMSEQSRRRSQSSRMSPIVRKSQDETSLCTRTEELPPEICLVPESSVRRNARKVASGD
jgi:hypothetical protein